MVMMVGAHLEQLVEWVEVWIEERWAIEYHGKRE